jgi:hypothetical protein
MSTRRAHCAIYNIRFYTFLAIKATQALVERIQATVATLWRMPRKKARERCNKQRGVDEREVKGRRLTVGAETVILLESSQASPAYPSESRMSMKALERWVAVAWIMCGPHEKHAVGITHHQHSLEESENPSDEGDALVASKRLCFMCLTQRHDQKSKICTSPAEQGQNPQHTEGHHARTHTHTHYTRGKLLTFCTTRYTGNTTQFVICFTLLALSLMCKLISCSNLGAFFDSKYCWFILASITRDSDEIPLTARSEIPSSPKPAVK